MLGWVIGWYSLVTGDKPNWKLNCYNKNGNFENYIVTIFLVTMKMRQSKVMISCYYLVRGSLDLTPTNLFILFG